MLRLRTVLLVTVLLGGMAGSPPAAGAAPGNAAADQPSTSTALLHVNFRGGFNGTGYQPAPGEVVTGTLTRDTGGETLADGVVGLGGGSAGLTFAPSAALTEGGAVTRSVAVEALAESAENGNNGFNTLLSIAGGAYYRFRSGLTGANEYGMNGPQPPYPTVTGAARAPSDTMFDHLSLIYSYVGPQESRLSTYVDGCQVGQTLVNGVPAEAAANAIGFGNEVHPGGTNRGFVGKLKALAVSSFTGSQPASILADPGAPHDPVAPANTIAVSACDSPQTVVQKAANVVPTADQQAWQSQELTGFIHFGPDTFTDRELGTGTEPVTTFAPTTVDTDQWARTFKQAGFKKVILVAKHHDGFLLFPTRYSTYSVKFDTAWQDGHGDLVGDFVTSMRKYGLQVGFYLSPADLHEAQPGGSYADGSTPHPVTIPTLQPGDSRAAAVRSGALPTFHFVLDDYNAYYLNQLYELLTQYGPVEEVWLDGANPTSRPESYDWPAWFELIHTLQPHSVVFNGQSVRWIGNEDAVARTAEWSPMPFAGDPATTHYNHEMDVEWSDDLGGRDVLTNAASYLSWFPGECDARIEDGWFWHPDSPPKSLDDLVGMYHTSVGRNCQLLLDVPPDRTGQLDAADVQRMQEFGDRLHLTFGHDPAVGSVASASSRNGSARNVVDGDPSTYWQPAGNTGTVTLSLGGPTPLTEVVLQEATGIGQRVESFAVDARVNGAWQQVATGTTIGYKRILQLDSPVTATALRLRITGARAAPAIATVGVSSYAPPTVTVTPATPVVQPGQSTGVDVTVTNTADSTLDAAELSLQAGTGWQVAPTRVSLGTLTPGATATAHATVTAPDVSGSTAVSATVTYTADGVPDRADGTATVAVPYPDLAASFDNVGITDDTGTNAGDVDGSQSSYSAQALASVGVTPGGTVTHAGSAFTWPDAAAGQSDNTVASGQAVTVNRSGSTLGFLVTSTYGASSGTATVVYADGSKQHFTLSSPDWYGAPAQGSDPAITAPYRNRPNNTQDHTPVNVYYRATTIDPAKVVADVVLPNISAGATAGTPAMHVFAVSVD